MGEDSARAAELIERTLYAMEAQSLITLWEEKFCKQNFLHTQYSYSRSQMLTIWTYFTESDVISDLLVKYILQLLFSLSEVEYLDFGFGQRCFDIKLTKRCAGLFHLAYKKKRPQHHQFVHLTSFFAALNQISSNLSLGCPEII